MPLTLKSTPRGSLINSPTLLFYDFYIFVFTSEHWFWLFSSILKVTVTTHSYSTFLFFPFLICNFQNFPKILPSFALVFVVVAAPPRSYHHSSYGHEVVSKTAVAPRLTALLLLKPLVCMPLTSLRENLQIFSRSRDCLRARTHIRIHLLSLSLSL